MRNGVVTVAVVLPCMHVGRHLDLAELGEENGTSRDIAVLNWV